MVTVILRGGLGNQMFQYAAGVDLALKKKTGLVFDTTFLNDRFPRKDFTYRTFDLDIFNLRVPIMIAPKVTTLSKISTAAPIPGVWLGLDLVWVGMKKLGASLFGRDKNPVLWGFYQSERYFKDNAASVRAAFQFRHPLTGEAVSLATKIENGNSVSIHVRRGDYNLPKYEKLYGATDVVYYEKAIAYIAERVESPHFFVFSDDIEWCRKNLKAPSGSIFVDDTSRGPKASFHLQLMSLCKHNIIANSTFSWWGGWLNSNPGKIIVAPKRWYADSSYEAADIIPDSWARL